MTGRAGQSSSRRRPGLWLALLALAIKAAIAPGYMIGPGEDGQAFAFTLCSGGQVAAAPTHPHADMAEHGHGGEDGHSHSGSHGAHGLCSFAGAAAPVLATAETPALVMRAEAGRGAAPPPESQARPAPAGPPLSARGPPRCV